MRYNKNENKSEFSHGSEVDFIKTLQKVLNFTYDVIDCTHAMGVKLPNNSWTGIIGMLQKNVMIYKLFISLCILFEYLIQLFIIFSKLI